MFRLPVVCGSFALLPIMAALALATPADYCDAYARDFANAGPADKAQWQSRFDNALRDCLYQYTEQKDVVQKQKADVAVSPSAEKPTAKPKSAPKPAPAKVVAPAVSADVPVKQVLAASLKPTPGSPEWIDYCSRKYASFDAAMGTYRSFSGQQKKCLVTKDFK